MITNYSIIEVGGAHVIVKDGNALMDQRSISKSLNITKQGVSYAIKSIEGCGAKVESVPITIKIKQGAILVNRIIKHYDLKMVLMIAAKTGRTQQLSKVVHEVKRNGVDIIEYNSLPRKEIAFGYMLESTLRDIVEIIPQCTIGSWRVDFYIPSLNLIVEYDEKAHCKTSAINFDAERQRSIENMTGGSFIRVAEGKEYQGLNAILKYLTVGYNPSVRSLPARDIPTTIRE